MAPTTSFFQSTKSHVIQRILRFQRFLEILLTYPITHPDFIYTSNLCPFVPTRFANVPSWKRELILKKEAQALAEAAGVEAAKAAAMKEEKDDKKKCPLKEKGIITKWEDKRDTK